MYHSVIVASTSFRPMRLAPRYSRRHTERHSFRRYNRVHFLRGMLKNPSDLTHSVSWRGHSLGPIGSLVNLESWSKKACVMPSSMCGSLGVLVAVGEPILLAFLLILLLSTHVKRMSLSKVGHVLSWNLWRWGIDDSGLLSLLD